jgi:CBS-domain-containing membrane protein
LKTRVVKEMMVPLSEYATVSDRATLQEAVLALRQSQTDNRHRKYLHRAILVLDAKGAVVGKVSFVDVLRALEPKYDQMLSSKKSFHVGFTPAFQRSMIEQLKLWEAPMEHLCEKAAKLNVSSFMTAPVDAEFIESRRTLDEAIHQLVLGCHQSLLVTENNAIIGILRLTDVFEVVADEIVKCEI